MILLRKTGAHTTVLLRKRLGRLQVGRYWKSSGECFFGGEKSVPSVQRQNLTVHSSVWKNTPLLKIPKLLAFFLYYHIILGTICRLIVHRALWCSYIPYSSLFKNKGRSLNAALCIPALSSSAPCDDNRWLLELHLFLFFCIILKWLLWWWNYMLQLIWLMLFSY